MLSANTTVIYDRGIDIVLNNERPQPPSRSQNIVTPAAPCALCGAPLLLAVDAIFYFRALPCEAPIMNIVDIFRYAGVMLAFFIDVDILLC